MSKTLFEEAIADVKQVKEVAEANAKRAIIEAVTPKIKDLIEKQLLGEIVESDDEFIESVSEDVTSDLIEETVLSTESNEPQYEMTAESVETLLPFSAQAQPVLEDRVELKVYELADRTNEIIAMSVDEKVSDNFANKINETIQEIEDMYSYLQESVDSSRSSKLEAKLEHCFEILNAVKESTMRMKDLVSESNLSEDQELTLKVTGLPDDVELDKLNIDLISDEEGEDGMGVPPVPTGEPGGEEPMGAEAPLPSEGYGLDELGEDDVVEISESMLKQEIARMKKLAESGVAPVNACGEKMSADVLDDFGGGESDGEPWLDGEVSTADKDNMVKQGVVKESDDMSELDAMSEEDEMDEVHADTHAKMDDDHLPEAKRTLVSAEKVLSEARSSVASTKEKLAEAKATYVKYKDSRHSQKARALAEKAFKAHLAAKAVVAEATKKVERAQKVLKEALKNSATKQLAESKAAVESLRKQLVETNLLNAKLIHANKLLQTEGLSAKQKAVIIDKLDEAQNLREVKLVYESLVKALGGDKKVVKEGADRQVVAGSSSRVAKPSGAATLNEGYETARWAKLAGLSK